MNTLYYGNGECSIEGGDIRAIQIHYKGSIKIIDKTPEGFHIETRNGKILIFPLVKDKTLNDLFEYEGEFRILGIIVSNSAGEKITTSIKKVMDYAELLGNSEDITINSEKLSSGYKTIKRSNKIFHARSNNIKDQHTSNFRSLYLEDGERYKGKIHIHFDGSIMTGGVHSKDSNDLFFKVRGKLVSNRKFIRRSAQRTVNKKIRKKNY